MWRCICQVTCLQPQLTECAVNVTGSGVTGAFCVDLATNPNYCGNCTNRCAKDVNNHGTRTCTNGTCGITCLPAYPTQVCCCATQALAKRSIFCREIGALSHDCLNSTWIGVLPLHMISRRVQGAMQSTRMV